MLPRMGKRKDFIFIGRTSTEIAASIVDNFGHGERTPDGRPAITRPGPVIQFGVNAFEDGEVNTTLFANGDQPNHPVVQTLDEKQKNEIACGLEGSHVTIVHSASGQNTSMRAMGLVFLAKSLKSEYGVKDIRVIAPALPFMRSDRIFRKADQQGAMRSEFNAVAALHFAELLHDAGVRRVIGIEPHSRDGVKHYREVFGKKKAQFINMGDFYADQIREEYGLIDTQGNCLVMVGSPDGMNKPGDYGMARASSFGDALYKGTPAEKYSRVHHNFRDRPYMFGIHKERISSKETEIVGFHGEVSGKTCIIIDDIISGGSTTLHAAEELKKRGARDVVAIATHAVLVNGAARRLTESPFLDRIMLTDTIPSVADKLDENQLTDHHKVVIRSVAPLIVQAIEPKFRPHKKLIRAYERLKPQVG